MALPVFPTQVYPTSTNVFYPDLASSGRLVVDFSRKPDEFALNRWAQIIPVKKSRARYILMTVEEAGRLLSTDMSTNVFPDGAEAREGNDGTESFSFQDPTLTRFQYPVTVGDLAIENAEWPLDDQQLDIEAQKAMTARTQLAVNVATNSSLYAGTHVLNVPSITGNTGTWDNSTTARADIKRSLDNAAYVIRQDTLAKVKYTDLMLVMSESCARQTGESQEIIDYLAKSPSAWGWIQGNLPGQGEMRLKGPNHAYGLPAELYAIEIVVEDAFKVTTPKGATTVKSPVLPGTTPFMFARIGGLEGRLGGPNFSSLCMFVHEKYDLTVERMHEDKHKRELIRVLDMFVPILVAPVSSALFTNAVTNN